MKYIANKILAAICLLAPAAAALAAPAGAEAEYRKLSRSWILNQDGSQEYNYSMELAIFTHAAMNGMYGESFIVYNPEYQTLEINSSYTVRKDGSIVETPANAFVEVLPAVAANAPAYNHLKEMVVVHTGLELGATICLDYTIVTKPGYFPELDVYEYVRQASPVREYTLSVTVPETRKLDYVLSGVKGKTVSEVSDGQKTYTWTLRNLKADSRLSDTYYFDSPYFAANTYASPEDMAGTFSSQMTGGESLTELKTLTEKVTSGASTDTEKLMAVYGYIRNSYAHIPLSLSTCGYRIRPVTDVSGSAYGTDSELVNVFHGLLSATGLKSDVCAVFGREDNQGMGLKNTILYIRTEADGQEYILAPTASATRKAILYRQYCPALDMTEGSFIPPAPQNARISSVSDIALDGERLEIKTEVSVPDLFLDPEGSEARAITAGDSNASVRKEVSYTVFSYENESSVEKAGGYMVIALPDYPFSATRDRHASGSYRDIMLTLPAAYDESYTYRIHLGDRTLCTPETDTEIVNGVGRLSVSIHSDGGDAVVTRSLKLSKSRISTKEYPEYMELMRVWKDHNHTRILVK